MKHFYWRCLLCTCIPDGTPHVHIFSQAGKQLQLAEKIKHINIQIEAELPQNVCFSCFAKLEVTHELVTSSQQARITLIKQRIENVGQEGLNAAEEMEQFYSRCLLCTCIPDVTPHLHIYSKTGNQQQLADKINKFLNIQIIPELQNVCHSCMEKLEVTHELVTSSQQARIMLLQIKQQFENTDQRVPVVEYNIMDVPTLESDSYQAAPHFDAINNQNPKFDAANEVPMDIPISTNFGQSANDVTVPFGKVANDVALRCDQSANNVEVQFGQRANNVAVTFGETGNDVALQFDQSANHVEVQFCQSANVLEVQFGQSANDVADIAVQFGKSVNDQVQCNQATNDIEVQFSSSANDVALPSNQPTNYAKVPFDQSANDVAVQFKHFDTVHGTKDQVGLHGDLVAVRCTICKFKASNKFALGAHIRSEHLDVVINRPLPFYCDLCDKAFHSYNRLMQHRRGHVHDPKQKCVHCGKLISVYLMSSHMNLHESSVKVKNGQSANDVAVQSANNVAVKNSQSANEVKVQSANDVAVQSANNVAVKNGQSANDVADKNGQSANNVAVKNGQSTNDVAVKNDQSANDVAVKNGQSANDIADNNGQSTNDIADKNGQSANNVAVKNGQSANDVAVKNGQSTNDIADKNGQSTNDVAVQSANDVAVKNGQSANHVTAEKPTQKAVCTHQPIAKGRLVTADQKKRVRRPRTQTDVPKKSTKFKRDYDGVVTCEICNEQVTHKYKLIQHKNQKHNLNLPFICEQCGKKYSNLRSFYSHFSNVHGIKNHEECEICGKILKKNYYMTHLKLHQNNLSVGLPGALVAVTCAICKFTAKNKFTLLSHFNSNHLDVVVEHLPFYCDLCGRVFHSYKRVMLHRISNVHDPKQKCDICGKLISQYLMSGHLKVHESTAKAIEKFQKKRELAEDWKKRKNSIPLKSGKDQLDELPKIDDETMRCRHPSNESLNGAMMLCEQCGLMFGGPENCHDSTVETEKPLSFKHAGQDQFPTYRDYMEHKFQHVLTCSICSNKYSNPDNLRAHMQVMHTKPIMHTKPMVECKLCGKMFRRRKLWHEHLLGTHGSVKHFEHCNCRSSRKPYQNAQIRSPCSGPVQ